MGNETKLENCLITDTSNEIKFVLPKSYAFEPKEDITAYELAECLKYFFGTNYGIESEPETIKRHFKEVD